MEFTGLLDEYLELKKLLDNGEIAQFELERLAEVTDEINARIRGEI